jgi:predicted Zn-dependent protease
MGRCPPVRLGWFLGLLSVCAPTAQERPPFHFTPPDLRLFEQVNLADERYEREGLVYRDPAVERLLERLTRPMLEAEPTLERVTWRFRILRSPVFNAFASPNGTVYVHTGLFAALDSEAQLAGVLAHEVSHILKRHSYFAQRSTRKRIAAINIINVALASASLATPYNSGWRVVLAALGDAPVIVAASIYGYNRELERDADFTAVRLLDGSGHGAAALVDLFEAMRRRSDLEGEIEPLFWSSHPRLDERIADVSKLGPPSNPSGGRSPDELAYLETVAGVVRHNARLAIDAGRPRSAVADMQRLADRLPESSENLFGLAEAYSALGGRTARPLEDELSTRARVKAMNKRQKRTPEEYERGLLETREGREAFRVNVESAERLYRRSLAVDPGYHTAHRGLGFLYERAGDREAALRAFRAYLQAAPDAADRSRIERRVERLEGRGAS